MRSHSSRELPILGGVQVSAGEGQRSLKVLPVHDTVFSVLIPQGMEGSPREEVFLGSFQFQPENIIQTFQLQVPHKGCPTKCTVCRALPRGPHGISQQPQEVHDCH